MSPKIMAVMLLGEWWAFPASIPVETASRNQTQTMHVVEFGSNPLVSPQSWPREVNQAGAPFPKETLSGSVGWHGSEGLHGSEGPGSVGRRWPFSSLHAPAL